MDASDVALAMAALAPAVCFSDGTDRPGGSKLGGCPELARGVAWPMRKALENLDDVVRRGGSSHAEHIATYGRDDVPFPFFAQIDCAEVRRAAPDVARDLPERGRLLFFYDIWCGPWGDDDVSALVLHDVTPAAKLVACTPPKALLAIEEQERDAWRAAMVAAKLDPNEYDAPRCIHPTRALAPERSLVLPDFMSFDARRHPALLARADDDDFSEAYGAFADWGGGLFEGPDGGARLHRMLGPPVCVQRDPRVHGVLQDDATRWTNPGWSDPAFRERIASDGLAWRVLLQIDLADLTQVRLTEGVVYFIIRADALAAGDFSGVRAVYQQT